MISLEHDIDKACVCSDDDDDDTDARTGLFRLHFKDRFFRSRIKVFFVVRLPKTENNGLISKSGVEVQKV